MVLKYLSLLLVVGLVLVVADVENIENYLDSSEEVTQEVNSNTYTDSDLLELVSEILHFQNKNRKEHVEPSMSGDQYPKCLKRGAVCTKSDECCSHRCARKLSHPFCF